MDRVKDKKNDNKILRMSKIVLRSGLDLTRGIIYELTTYSKESLASQCDSLNSALKKSKKIDIPTREAILAYYKSASESVQKAKDRTINQTVILTNAILASDFSRNMSKWLEGMTESMPSPYDISMDEVFNKTNIGGGKLHRLFDGSHTPWEAWDKIRDALPDDTFAQEVIGGTQALLKDMVTERGLPLFTMKETDYHSLANALRDQFNIPKDWTSDFLHYNGAEVIGTSMGVISLALNWNKEEVKEFSSIASSLGVSTIASANPLLGVVTLVSLAKSFTDAKRTNKYSDFVNGLTKGGVGTGVIVGTSAIIGGPAWVGVVTGMCVGVCAQKVMCNVDVVDISSYVQNSIRDKLSSQHELILV